MLLTTIVATTCTCAHFTAHAVNVFFSDTKKVAHYHEGQKRFTELLFGARYPYAKSIRKRNRFAVLYGKKTAMTIERHIDDRRSKNRNENESRSKYRNEKRKAHRELWEQW